MIIITSPWFFALRGHAVLIFGALGATLLGAFTALQLDLVLAAGGRLMHPAGQALLIKTTVTASLTGLMCWVVCALLARAISRAALRPYSALADHFERLADGDSHSSVHLRGPVPEARRLARVVVLFQQRALESKRSEAALQARYDRLDRDHAGERRVILGMLLNKPFDPASSASGHQAPIDTTPAGLDVREPLSASSDAFSDMAPQSGRYDSLYEDARERSLLMDMLMDHRLQTREGLQPLLGLARAEFDIPERRSATPDAVNTH